MPRSKVELFAATRQGSPFLPLTSGSRCRPALDGLPFLCERAGWATRGHDAAQIDPAAHGVRQAVAGPAGYRYAGPDPAVVR